MARAVHVSRNNLAACPGCQRHIYITPGAQEAACPFCGLALAFVSEPRSARGFVRGALAVSLLASSVAACTEEVGQPVYGVAIGDVVDASDASDSKDASDSASDQGDIPEEDTPALPPYGIPPDDTDASDPSEDAPEPDADDS